MCGNHLFIPLRSWFRLYSRDVIARSVLHPIREKAGLGSPPEPYYTNNIESKTISLSSMSTERAHLPEFVDKMKDLMSEQCSDREGNSFMWYHSTVIYLVTKVAQNETKISHFMKTSIELGDADSKEKCQPSTFSTPLDCLDHLKHGLESISLSGP